LRTSATESSDLWRRGAGLGPARRGGHAPPPAARAPAARTPPATASRH